MAEIYYEPTGCNCDGTNCRLCGGNNVLELTIVPGTEYAQADINAAAIRALELASEGQTLGMHH